MNNVILSGNLVEEVKCSKTKNGKLYLRNKIAVKDGYKTDFEKTYFINLEVFGDRVLDFKDLKKGNLVEIQGKLVVESYKKDDKWINITKIVVFKVEKLNFKKKEPTLQPVILDDDLPF